jgi:fucose 4-O-acetylase-like acetyltransferase
MAHSLSMSTDKKRLDYIDIAKGLGMLTVIWGHINGGFTNIFVYAFHMPLFFFLSGLVFRADKYNSFKEFAIRKVKTLIIPYLMFSFITWLVWVAYNLVFHNDVDSYFMPLLQTFVAQGSGGFLVHNVPLWFVSCLLIVEFLYFFINKLRNEMIIIVSCCVLGVLSFFLEKCSAFFDFKLLPWSIGVAFAAIVFYSVGNILMTRGVVSFFTEKCNSKKILFWIILLLMTMLLVFLAPLNGHISMGHEQYNNRLLFYLNGFIGSFCVLLFSILAEKVFTNKSLSWVKWIGLNSLYFMLIENPIKGFVVSILGKCLHLNDEGVSHNFGWSMIAFLISVLVTVFAVKFILLIKSKRKVKAT